MLNAFFIKYWNSFLQWQIAVPTIQEDWRSRQGAFFCTQCTCKAPPHRAPKLPAHGSSGEVQRTSTASSFPGSVLFLPPPAPDKRGPSINSNIQTTSLQACESSARPEMGVIVSSPLAALVHEINPLVFTGCATPSAQAGTWAFSFSLSNEIPFTEASQVLCLANRFINLVDKAMEATGI